MGQTSQENKSVVLFRLTAVYAMIMSWRSVQKAKVCKRGCCHSMSWTKGSLDLELYVAEREIFFKKRAIEREREKKKNAENPTLSWQMIAMSFIDSVL